MAVFDLEALSLSELKKMQKDVTKAISTFEDRQKAGDPSRDRTAREDRSVASGSASASSTPSRFVFTLPNNGVIGS